MEEKNQLISNNPPKFRGELELNLSKMICSGKPCKWTMNLINREAREAPLGKQDIGIKCVREMCIGETVCYHPDYCTVQEKG